MSKLEDAGWEIIHASLSDSVLAGLRESAFTKPGPGWRCLLDQPLVRETAGFLRAQMIATGYLPARAVAIQAIAFDKTPAANWKVPWHQDVLFPFANPVTTPDYDLASVKDGVDYARPPRVVLEEMLALRLHLDDCGLTDGPLRVAPGSHGQGIVKSHDLSAAARRHGESLCLATTGEALLMKPLLLHASSPASAPNHRRVLHFVFHSGAPLPERWHRAVR